MRNGPSIIAEPSVTRELPTGQEQLTEPLLRRRYLVLSRASETLLVLALSGALAVAMNWRQAREPSSTVPGDLGDPLLITWQLGWAGHVLRHPTLHPWTTPAFLGAPDNLAFTDVTWGYAPLTFLVGDDQRGSLMQLNLAGLLAVALSFAGAYLLARVLGAGVPGALLAGAGFAFAPWRLAQLTHLNVFSTGGAAIALALLAHGHGWSMRSGWRGRPGQDGMRLGWVAAGWLVACWQISLGFATGIVFGYLLATVAALLALGWLVHARRLLPSRILAGDLLGAAVFGALVWWLSRPFWRVVQAHPEGRRDQGWIDALSPPWRGLLTAPDTSVVWGQRQSGWRAQLFWPPETALSPGLVLIGLAALGVLLSAWPWRRRLALLLAVAALAVLSLGMKFAGGGRYSFLPLYHHLPGWETMRTPGRLMVWVTLGLCLLAAGLLTRLSDPLFRRPRPVRVPVQDGELAEDLFTPARDLEPVATVELRRRHSAWWWVLIGPATLLLCVPAAAVSWEGRGDVPQLPVPQAPIDLATLPEPILVLPSSGVADYLMMTWQTDGWPVIANGSSGFEPQFEENLRAQVATFPDADSVQALRRHHIRTVLTVPDRLVATYWRDSLSRSPDGLGIRWRMLPSGAIVYDIPQ